MDRRSFLKNSIAGLAGVGLLLEGELLKAASGGGPYGSIKDREPDENGFILPEGFSRKMSVELSTLMVTSKLMTGFDDPPVYHKKLRQQAMIQALRTKKRYKAVVGDAKNSDDFEIRVLKPQGP